MAEPVELHAEAIVATLNRYQVKYVVIGALGAILHGAPMITADLDITPDAEGENLRRLSRALRELGARLRLPGTEETVEIKLDEDLFTDVDMVTLRTSEGDIDVMMRPSAPWGHLSYEQLSSDATVFELPEPVPTASLDHIIASKTAASRDKDLRVLPLLHELRSRLEER